MHDEDYESGNCYLQRLWHKATTDGPPKPIRDDDNIVRISRQDREAAYLQYFLYIIVQVSGRQHVPAASRVAMVIVASINLVRLVT